MNIPNELTPKPGKSHSEEPTLEQIAKQFWDNQKRYEDEARLAGQQAHEAMGRIAPKIFGRNDREALLARNILLSIYGAVEVNMSNIGYIGHDLRKDLCAVFLGVNKGGFEDGQIRKSLVAAGDRKSSWFFAGLPAGVEAPRFSDREPTI